MMCEADKAYYRRRVEEEEIQIGLARNTSVRSVHEKLVELYGAKIVALKCRPHDSVVSISRDQFQETFEPIPAFEQAAAEDS